MTTAGIDSPQAQKAPWWLLGIFIVSTLVALFFTVVGMSSIDSGYSGPDPLVNAFMNSTIALEAVTYLCLQATALVGLYLRRHWGRDVATVAAGFWALTLFGIIPAAIVIWLLHRRWNPGTEPSFYRDHPTPQAYFVGLLVTGVAFLLAWLWFLYLYLVPLLVDVVKNSGGTFGHTAGEWYPLMNIALFLSLPFWALIAVTLVGLRRRHDWGAVLAMVTAMVYIVSVFGFPFGVAGLILLWRWSHPALARVPLPAPA